MFRQAGMSAAHVWDHYHLIQQEWPNLFGFTLFKKNEKELRKMLHTFSEEDFNTCYKASR